MIGFALPIVWMNERRQVKMAELISLAEENVKKDLNIDEVSSENNKSLVHLQGMLKTLEKVEDQRFYVAMENCLKIKRVVEMLQWVEQKNGEEYFYTAQW